MGSFRLSICIPTYNRSVHLRKSCQVLLPQMAQAGDVQLCISDNGSTDDTEKTVGELIREHPGIPICYRRQAFNKGFAHNLLDVVRMAEGEYVFACGDDDQFEADGVQELVAGTRRQQAVVAYSSHPDVGDYFIKGTRRAKAEFALEGVGQVNRALGVFFLSFIGNAMVRRADYLANIEPEFLQSAYPHVGVLLNVLRRERGVFIDRPILHVDDSQRTWRMNQARYSSVDMARLQTECFLEHEGDGAAARYVYRRVVGSLPRAIFYQRCGVVAAADNRYASLALGNVLECYRASRFYQIAAGMLCCAAWTLPLFVLKGIYKLRG